MEKGNAQNTKLMTKGSFEKSQSTNFQFSFTLNKQNFFGGIGIQFLYG